ncbi:MAG TPA: hypothetical protein VEI02_10185 [Planctomycetota bacterium]|nr:hypothetical protein [Planctomycetota bacterium]
MARVVRCGVWLLTAASAMTAQAPASRPAAPDDVAARLSDAVRGAFARPYRFLGSVTASSPEEKPPVYVEHVEPRKKPFAGRVEILRTDAGERLYASRGAAPAIAVFDDGRRLLLQTTRLANEEIEARRLSRALKRLTDAAALSADVAAAAWRTGPREGGGVVAEGAIAAARLRDLSVADSAARGIPLPRRVEARFELDAEGALVAFRFVVTESDPQGTWDRLVEKSGFVEADKIRDADELDGDVATYEFRRIDGAPSKRAAGLLAFFRELDADVEEPAGR